MALFSLLNIVEMQEPRGLDPVTVSNFLSTSIFILCCIIPVIFLVYFCLSKPRWADDDFLKRVGSFLEGTRIHNNAVKNASIAFTTLFCLRRLILALTLIYMQWFFLAQVAIQVFFSQIMLILVQWFRPMNSTYLRRIETANELVVILVLTMLLCFSDLIQDNITKRYLGFVYIGVFSLFGVIHLILLLAIIIHKLRLQILRFYRRCKV